MSRVRSFSDWSSQQANNADDLQEGLRSISISAAGAIIIAQSSRIRSNLSKVSSVNASLEDKIEAIAAALDAFNTKTTAMAALVYAVSRQQ